MEEIWNIIVLPSFYCYNHNFLIEQPHYMLDGEKTVKKGVGKFVTYEYLYKRLHVQTSTDLRYLLAYFWSVSKCWMLSIVFDWL